MRPDVIVVGGGIAGLSTALECAALGARVRVLDRQLPGAASRVSAGLLAPSIGSMPESMRAEAFAARDVYPRFVARLAEDTGITVVLNRLGILEIPASEGEAARLRDMRDGHAAWMTSSEVQFEESLVNGEFGALRHEHDGAVNSATLMDALAAAARRHPSIELADELAGLIRFDDDGVTVHSSGGASRSAPTVVVANGAWAGAIAGVPSADVRPLGGQLLTLAGGPLRHVCFVGGGYLAPHADGVLVGATSEDTGFAATATGPGREELLTIARRASSALADCSVLRHWAGVRPMSHDGAPILGPDPEHPALVYACGYSRNGILFGPWAGAMLAQGIVSGNWPAALAPFSVDPRKRAQ